MNYKLKHWKLKYKCGGGYSYYKFGFGGQKSQKYNIFAALELILFLNFTL